MRSISLFVLLALLFTACGGGDKAPDTAKKEKAAKPKQEIPPQPSEPVPGVEISPKPEAVDFPDARITSMSYQDGTFRFGVDGGSEYQLGAQTPDAESTMCANSAKGQHIHLIVNNEPYAAKYQSEFEFDLADGEHYMMAFLSRSYHESLKHRDSYKALKLQVKDKSTTSMESINTPMLFYSRPKGTYQGKDAENVMLDFYPVNASIGKKHLIKVQVAGHTFTVDEWKPYLLTGLPMGENTVTLTLTDMNGNTLDTPYNPVSRTFTLKPAPDQVQ